MARQFDILITQGTVVGPYSVYYNTVSSTTYATRLSTGLNATGITYTDLTTAPGVRVGIPDGATSIILYNEVCPRELIYPIPQVTPTPTPTNTPTVTPFRTPTPTPTTTQTGTPTPTPTKRATVACNPQTTFYWVWRRSNRYSSAILNRGNVSIAQSDSSGNPISARLDGFPKLHKTSPLIKFSRTIYSVEIYDCNNNLCCVVYSARPRTLVQDLYTFIFETNLVTAGFYGDGKNTRFCQPVGSLPKSSCARFTIPPWTIPFPPAEEYFI